MYAQEKNSAFGIRHSAFGDKCRSLKAVCRSPAFPVSKKTACVFFLFFFYRAFCVAAPSVDFFAGAGGKLAFPSASQKEKGGAGAGGGGYIEGGIEFFNIQTELFTSFSYLSNGGLVERMLETQIGLGASYVFSKKNARRLPAWLAVRPHIGVFADIYAADVYKTAVQKDEGIRTFANGVTAGFNPGLFFDFPNLITVKRVKIIPTAGIEESIRFDRVSGIYATPFLSAGVRVSWELPKKNSVLPQTEERIEEQPESESLIEKKMEEQIEENPTPAPAVEEQTEEQSEPETLVEEEIEDLQEEQAAEQTEVESPVEEQIEEQIEQPQEEQAEPETPIEEQPELETPVAEQPAPPEPIYLPFVIFPPDSAALFNAPNTEPEAAESVLNEIARILTENPDFNVTIIGYANSITGTSGENKGALIPLSLKRAECVRAELEKRGIDPMRMSVRGEGAGEYSSAAGWKNRRVEFVLIKR